MFTLLHRPPIISSSPFPFPFLNKKPYTHMLLLILVPRTLVSRSLFVTVMDFLAALKFLPSPFALLMIALLLLDMLRTTSSLRFMFETTLNFSL